MELKEIDLDSIDLDDERYRISECLVSARLETSLRDIGQLCPVMLLDGLSGRPAVVCGFRRVHALRRIGRRSVLARFLSASECNPLAAFRMALLDNLSFRLLNALEKARAVYALKHFCCVDNETLVESYLPLLELAPHRNVLRSYLQLHLVLPDLKSLLLEGKLTLASVERLGCRSQEDQKTIAEMSEKARWSASLQRQVLDLVEELSAAGSCGIREVVEGTEITAVLNDPLLSPFQRGERAYGILYRRRNPQLSRAREKFREERLKLDLPARVRLIPEPFFETSRLRVEFEALSAGDLREVVAALHGAAQASALDRLFQVC